MEVVFSVLTTILFKLSLLHVFRRIGLHQRVMLFLNKLFLPKTNLHVVSSFLKNKN